jgi:capsular exopolysaccharide synthesis family protein
MELSDYLRVLRAHWTGVVALVLAAVAAAALYSITQPKVYAANATGFVSAGNDSNPALSSVADSLANSRAKSYVDIAKSRATARTVIERLDLDVSPAALIGNITVDQPVDTVLLKITARSSTPRGAQQLADAWVSALAAQVQTIEDPKGTGGPGLKIVPVESAELPAVPISPRTQLNLLIGVVIGLLLGFAYALVRNQLDRRLRSSAAVEKQFGVTVVGAIPASSDLSHDPGEPAALAVLPRSAKLRPSESAEAFRKLRTNLQFMDVDNPPRVIVMTSPQQGDGKSTTAANLAAALAVTGEKVTLVDGDLRRPTVAESFRLVEGAGLTDVLVGRVSVTDVEQYHPDHPNLRVLAAGGTPPNPSELLGSQAMRKLLRQLAEDSIVIVDAPPLLPVTDAAVLSAVSDGAFIVISSGRTLDSELGAALGHLEAVNGKALGVIFNRVPRRDSASGYYGGSYQSTARDRGPAAPSQSVQPAAEEPVRPGPPAARSRGRR